MEARITLTEERAEAILRAFDDQYAEGQGPPECGADLVRELLDAFESLRPRYGWLLEAWVE